MSDTDSSNISPKLSPDNEISEKHDDKTNSLTQEETNNVELKESAELEEQSLHEYPYYIMALFRVALLYLFGVRVLTIGILCWTAYKNLSFASLSMLWLVLNYFMFGFWSTICLIVTFASLQLYLNWGVVKFMLLSAKLTLPQINRIYSTCTQITSTLSSVTNNVLQHHFLQSCWSVIMSIIGHQIILRVVKYIDNMIKYICDLFSSLVSQLMSWMNIPFLTKMNRMKTQNHKKHFNNTNEDRLNTGENNVTKSETDLTEDLMDLLNDTDDNNITKSDTDLTKDLMDLLNEPSNMSIDLSKIPPPPRNPDEMKAQLDMVLSLMKQTQELAKVVEHSNNTNEDRSNTGENNVTKSDIYLTGDLRNIPLVMIRERDFRRGSFFDETNLRIDNDSRTCPKDVRHRNIKK